MVIFAGIPTLGMSDLLYPLARVLSADPSVDRVGVWNNGVTSSSLVRMLDDLPGVDVIEAHGLGLYTMWNEMIAWGRDAGADLAILNDDIAVCPGALALMARALRSDDRYWICGTNYLDRQGPEVIEVPCGTYRRSGIGGWAFMVTSERCPTIDPSFEVWFGDDDLLWKIQNQGGRACVARDVKVQHATSTTVNGLPWVAEAIERDTARWANLGRAT